MKGHRRGIGGIFSARAVVQGTYRLAADEGSGNLDCDRLNRLLSEGASDVKETGKDIGENHHNRIY
jgi:ABC-type ATPase involved in cell division